MSRCFFSPSNCSYCPPLDSHCCACLKYGICGWTQLLSLLLAVVLLVHLDARFAFSQQLFPPSSLCRVSSPPFQPAGPNQRSCFLVIALCPTHLVSSASMQLMDCLGFFSTCVCLKWPLPLISTCKWQFMSSFTTAHDARLAVCRNGMVSNINFEVSDRFTGIIFPNFCYHAQKIYCTQKENIIWLMDQGHTRVL